MTQINPRHGDTSRELWPSQYYLRQINVLKNAIGQNIFLVEFKKGITNLGVQYSGKALGLLDVISFPRLDPANRIAPHIIILSDGRGVNLGRVARITVNKPFSPSTADILYQDSFLMDEFLMRERRLSKESIAACSKALLGDILGKPQSLGVTKRSLLK